MTHLAQKGDSVSASAHPPADFVVMSPFENAVASDHLPGVNWTAPGKPDGCPIHLVMHTPENTDGGTLAPSDRPQDDEGTSQTGAPDRTGYSITRGDAHVQSHDDHSHSST
jgi:hypothetical protein